ncbi:hypothetical protein JZ751_029206 [Albula glossodonta]|uniref:Uncharacterized protein n=1 Tax=Albula glossodonta TaxID=121402 RepID=A0A8T2P9H1_9TELE|nr:hypothetical protein JZ751_029206 [Albula glossodonta]
MGQIPQIFILFTVFISGVTMMIGEQCEEHSTMIKEISTVTGYSAMLNCKLARTEVFNYRITPYNISWYEQKTGRELSGVTGSIHVRGSMLWFLTATLEDAGEYQCVLRTPERCFKQALSLTVKNPDPEYCGLPYTSYKQIMYAPANEELVCHLEGYMENADNYSIQWYKNCTPIQEGEQYTPFGGSKLKVQKVHRGMDKDVYSCHVNFSLSGSTGHMALSFAVEVIEHWHEKPSISEPVNEIVKADYGSPFSKTCRVFVLSKGLPIPVVYWMKKKKNEESLTSVSTSPSERVHYSNLSDIYLGNGIQSETLLRFTEVKEEDFGCTYVCFGQNDKGSVRGNFTLQPRDPDLKAPLIFVFMGLVLVFVTGTMVHSLLKIDIALWCRSSLPYLYSKPGSDGKKYDAFVVYPQMGSCSWAQTFVLHTLPQVLEESCGYRLFIYGRDSTPGEAVVSNIQESLAKSSVLLFLYTASTFSESTSGNKPDEHLLLTQQMGMHCALMEDSMRVLLVELEEVTDYSSFPTSLQHLRRKQGVVQWWRQGGQGPEQLCPSSRFWKKVRYSMPPRGQREVQVENTLLEA